LDVRLFAYAGVVKMTAFGLQINALKRVTISAKQHTLRPFKCEISANTCVFDALFAHENAGVSEKVHALISPSRRYGPRAETGEKVATHLGKEMRERLLTSVEEATVPFRMAHETTAIDEGWLRAVRQAVGMPVEEVARRLGVQIGEIWRLERMERESRITLGALRRAAEAMDCELLYGLRPKRGMLSEMAAVRSAARAKALNKRRVAADDRRSEAGKPRRRRDPQLNAIKALVMLATGGE